jgi:hypothetical protein
MSSARQRPVSEFPHDRERGSERGESYFRGYRGGPVRDLAGRFAIPAGAVSGVAELLIFLLVPAVAEQDARYPAVSFLALCCEPPASGATGATAPEVGGWVLLGFYSLALLASVTAVARAWEAGHTGGLAGHQRASAVVTALMSGAGLLLGAGAAALTGGSTTLVLGFWAALLCVILVEVASVAELLRPRLPSAPESRRDQLTSPGGFDYLSDLDRRWLARPGALVSMLCGFVVIAYQIGSGHELDVIGCVLFALSGAAVVTTIARVHGSAHGSRPGQVAAMSMVIGGIVVLLGMAALVISGQFDEAREVMLGVFGLTAGMYVDHFMAR